MTVALWPGTGPTSAGREQIIAMVDLMITRAEAALANKDMAVELTPATKGLRSRHRNKPI